MPEPSRATEWREEQSMTETPPTEPETPPQDPQDPQDPPEMSSDPK
jgi:hypothetical protein